MQTVKTGKRGLASASPEVRKRVARLGGVARHEAMKQKKQLIAQEQTAQ